MRAIAVWTVVGGALLVGLAGLGAVTIGGAYGIETELLLIVLGLAAYGSFSVVAGAALFKYQAWARIATIVMTFIGIPLNLLSLFDPRPGQAIGVMFGLAWSIALLSVLMSSRAAKICKADYALKVAKSRASVPFYTSPFFWVPVLLVVLSFGLALIAVVALVILA